MLSSKFISKPNVAAIQKVIQISLSIAPPPHIPLNDSSRY